jgi:hypothetical protein
MNQNQGDSGIPDDSIGEENALEEARPTLDWVIQDRTTGQCYAIAAAYDGRLCVLVATRIPTHKGLWLVTADGAPLMEKNGPNSSALAAFPDAGKALARAAETRAYDYDNETPIGILFWDC